MNDLISIVIPVHNEAGNLALLHQQILTCMQGLNRPFEVIFVDDASEDGSLEELKKLSPATIVCLQQRSGQSCALDAGIKTAGGDTLITMDGDGQDDPAEIPLLLQKLNENYDVACGWRYQRQDGLLKRFISNGAHILRKILVNDGVHDAGCTLRAYKTACFRGLNLYGGMHRMIPALMRWKGLRITEIKVNHRPRVYGKSKYGLRRIGPSLLDMIHIWYWCRCRRMPEGLFAAVEGKHQPKYLIKETLKY